jgi:anti-anti-sigma regulatory factor
MPLFSKPLPKKQPPGGDAGARLGKGASPQHNAAPPLPRAGESASGGITITGFGAIDWSPTRRKIEVTQGHASMCAALENAVLLYASGHAEQALALLAKAVQDDDEAKRSVLAWLALFDLLQRAGDHVAFEKLALLYVVQFERSAPPWDARPRADPEPRPVAGGYIAVTGKLTAANGAQFDALRRAIRRNHTQARFDLAAVSDFDDAGARALADVLAEARRRRYPLRVQRSERLRRVLETAVTKGRAGGEGAWLLSLEMLQWANDRAAFDDRAVEYAVTFEVSPPSWEPPQAMQSEAEMAAEATAALAAADEAEAAGIADGSRLLEWSGVMVGPHSPQIALLPEFASARSTVPIDMSGVDRIDFVCAGALLNAINAVEAQRKVVQIFGATPIIRAMLLLIGVSAAHFVKKAN